MPVASFQIESIDEWLALRRHDVGGSDVGALFGVHTYKTLFKLYHEKRGEAFATPIENALMRRGKDLEPIIASKLAARYPDWHFKEPHLYLRDTEHRLGATPDLYGEDPDGNLVVCQLKAVSPYELKRRWSEGAAPEWILLQNLTELKLADAAYGLVVAFDVDGWDIREPYRIDRFPEVEAEIARRALAFMTQVDRGEEPPPDFMKDAGLLAARFPLAVPGKMIDLRADNRMPELCREYLALDNQLGELQDKLEAAKAELRDKLGDAEVARVTGYEVTNKQRSRRGYTVQPTSYRQLQVHAEEQQ